MAQTMLDDFLSNFNRRHKEGSPQLVPSVILYIIMYIALHELA